MKYIVLIICILSYSVAITKGDVYKAYKNKNYKQACTDAAKIYLYNKKDETLLSVFANSCLKVDNINRMAFPAMLLVRSSAARSNSIYFLTILYQKKLLYKSLIDGYDVSKFKFPTTNYILSKIFVMYADKMYTKSGSTYIFKDNKNKNISYKLNISNTKGVYKMILRTFKNGVIIKTRIYW